MGLGRLFGRGEQHVVAVYAEHRPQLQPRRGDGGAVRGQPPGGAVVGVRHENAGAGARGQAGYELDPAVVALLEADRGLAGPGSISSSRTVRWSRDCTTM
jgi:hypothetical protein